MPESPEDLYARVVAKVGVDGHLPAPPISDWLPFPWEVVDGEIAGAVLQPPLEREAPREGDAGGKPCAVCEGTSKGIRIWENDRFFVSMFSQPSGLPLVLMLQTREHLDFPDLDDDLAGECGRLSVWLCRIMERLEHVGRTHVMRIGDGAAHHHTWFMARPERFPQVLGSFVVDWDDILPPVSDDVRRADAGEVARHLATHDGTALL